jgi:hypothetical protein
MFKALFNQGYSKKFMDRIEFRRKEYYENRRIQTIRTNAAKMALNWTHEYPTGTPLSYIRDDIIETWERTAGVGIYANLDKKQNIPTPGGLGDSYAIETPSPTTPPPISRGTRKDPKAKAVMKKYKHEWRNPPDEGEAYINEGDSVYEAKLQREEDTLDNIAAYKIEK